MVVAQIPLWIIHSAFTAHNLSTSNQLPKVSETTCDCASESGARERGEGETQSQLNLWTNSFNSSRRSAIYCCDISLGRIATGGGDGKVRLWSLVSLFRSSKFDSDRQDGGVRNTAAGSLGRGGVACFKSGGGYDSSDSSASNSSEKNQDVETSKTLYDVEENKNVELSNGGRLGVEENVNDLTGLVRRKNQIFQDKPATSKSAKSAGISVTEKKRKRIEVNSVQDFSKTSLAPSKDMPVNPKQRLLCTLSSHSGSVLALRFSSSGRYLASSGDDADVLIYTRSSKPSVLYHGNLNQSNPTTQDEKDVEHWNRIRILRGHHLDVVGLAWAPGADSHLVSCSLDSTTPICVWCLNLDDPENNGMEPTLGQNGRYNASFHGSSSILHPYKVLGKNVHTSTVKGVAFDPAGKYVASSGDDPAICIWRAFDDWGLEARIDSSTGVFHSRCHKRNSQAVGLNNGDDQEEDVQALASLSLFRRISFAPDGSHVCGTNATLRGKNIAAMISREGWVVSTPRRNTSHGSNNTVPAGAANLVGHKQPVVSSRHCPYFFEVQRPNCKEMDKSETDEDHVEPSYSTLVALGDKKGFVTIWSTKKSRPIFKLQCSESRCTVTDISWGLIPCDSSNTENGSQSLAMLISLLDGYVVAVRFHPPDELGSIVSNEKRDRIFQHKYGIDLCSSGGIGPAQKRLVNDKFGRMLIENVLQYTMEVEADQPIREECINSSSDEILSEQLAQISSSSKKVDKNTLPENKIVSDSYTNAFDEQELKRDKDGETSNTIEKECKKTKQKVPRLRKKGKRTIDIFNSAEKAALAAEVVSVKSTRRDSSTLAQCEGIFVKDWKEAKRLNAITGQQNDREKVNMKGSIRTQDTPVIPQSTNQTIYTVELCVEKYSEENDFAHDPIPLTKVVGTCTNSVQNVPGLNGSFYCVTLCISCGGEITWKDQIVGAHCTAFSSSSTLMILGTNDGTVYIYGTSPSLGWKSGIAFRSHPPFILGAPVVRLNLRHTSERLEHGTVQNEMLIVTSDAKFSVYNMLPYPNLSYKGSLLAPMNQMRVSSRKSTPLADGPLPFPKLARIQMTESNQLLLILSQSSRSRPTFGGMLQGFLFNRNMNLWMRVSDSRFRFSHLYSTVPSSKLSIGLLSKLDRSVQAETSDQCIAAETTASGLYHNNKDGDLNSIYTKSHCEDRMACAVALQSTADFRHWLSQYIRRLASEGNETQLRLIIDMLLAKVTHTTNTVTSESTDKYTSCWWLSTAKSILGLDRRETVKLLIIPEMSKNRALQRLMDEVATEINVL